MGEPILIANQEKLDVALKKIGLDENFNIEVTNSTDTEKSENIKTIFMKNCKEKVSWKKNVIKW